MGEVPGDRTGRASFSTVKVIFDSRFIPAELLEGADFKEPFQSFSFGCDASPFPDDTSRKWVNLAIAAINHFIEHYRVVCDRSWLYPVTESVIQHFHVITEFLGSTKPPVTQSHMIGSGFLAGFGGAIADEDDELLRVAVSQPEPPNVLSTMFHEVISCFDLGRFRLAVIESAILFESFTYQVLSNWLEQNGCSDVEIEKRLSRSPNRPHDLEHLLRKTIREETGFAFNETSLYMNWKIEVSDLRNDIVHGRKFDVDEKAARRAFEIVDAASKLIIKNLFPDIEPSNVFDAF